MSSGKWMTLGSLVVAGLVLSTGATTANAGHYVYYSHRPVYAAPVYAAPVYAPAPVVVAPPPVVYARPAVVYAPPPVVYPAPVYRSFAVYGGYHGHHHRGFSFGFGYSHW
jgi:hypothetical protein